LLLKWAIQDQNTSQVSIEKRDISQIGAVKGAAFGTDSRFADAVAAVMRLPLSDAEKAEGVRRLLVDR
jgi:hypothetical protein